MKLVHTYIAIIILKKNFIIIISAFPKHSLFTVNKCTFKDHVYVRECTGRTKEKHTIPASKHKHNSG